MNTHDSHDQGLRRDLDRLLESGLTRRRWLGLIAAGGGAAALAACSRSNAVPSTGTDGAGGHCVQAADETAGPFPSDGSNRVAGVVSNTLAEAGVVRRDIRPSFGLSSNVAPGVALDLSLRLVDVKNGCSPLAGHALYLWQCDAGGRYSLYNDGVEGENYLRGVQLSDADGALSFRTIVPGCYRGRFPHLHYEVFPSLETTLDRDAALLTSQMAVPREACAATYAADASYADSLGSFSRMTLENDGIFDDNAPEQLAAMTIELSGEPGVGYAGSIVVGVAS